MEEAVELWSASINLKQFDARGETEKRSQPGNILPLIGKGRLAADVSIAGSLFDDQAVIIEDGELNKLNGWNHFIRPYDEL